MPEAARRSPAGALLAAAVALAVFSGTGARAFDSAGYEKAAATILCDCGCHPQSVADCTCGRAAEMRAEIRGMIESGMTGDAVIASYVERYGDKIRIAPTATGFNLLAWLGPLAALLGGVVGLLWLVRRWSRGGPESAVAGLPEPPPGDEAYLDRLRREVEERS